MATLKQAHTAKFITTKEGEVEETAFEAGVEVQVMQVWSAYCLVKDSDGHFYNIPKDLLSDI